MKPTISIIVAVYNVEKYIDDCLRSILGQSFEDYEIICVDDGSTDASYEMIRKYAEQDARIIVLHQENGGLSIARNNGIAHAKGHYLCFVDSDDMLAEGALRKMWDAVKDDFPDIVSYEMGPLLYDDESLKRQTNRDEYYRIDKEYPGIRPGRDFFVEMLENHDFADSGCLLLLNAAWLREKGITFYPGVYYEDSVFWIQCCFESLRMKHIKEQLYIYRIRNHSITTQKFHFKHEYSRIWQYSEFLRAVYLYAQNEREVRALAAYAEQSMASIKYVYRHLEEADKDKVRELDSLYGLIAKSMDIGKPRMDCNRELYLDGLMGVMKRFQHIILYGAGMVGNKMKRFMELCGMKEKIAGFAVSSVMEDMKVEDIPIRCICDYSVSEDTLILVSVRENFHGEMVEKARSLGFGEIRVIDNVLECLIDEKLEEAYESKG